MLVVDEADLIFSYGYEEDITTILRCVFVIMLRNIVYATIILQSIVQVIVTLQISAFYLSSVSHVSNTVGGKYNALYSYTYSYD